MFDGFELVKKPNFTSFTVALHSYALLVLLLHEIWKT